MGRYIPMPPGLSEEEKEKWYKHLDNHFKWIGRMIYIAWVLFMVFIGLAVYISVIR